MRIRILTWNVKFFPTRLPEGGLEMLADVVHPGPPSGAAVGADIFVLIEVVQGKKRAAEVGSLVAGGDGSLLRLLSLLQVKNRDWQLVPPAWLAEYPEIEAIAVFYRGDKLVFTGPEQRDYQGSPYQSLIQAGGGAPGFNAGGTTGPAGKAQFSRTPASPMISPAAGAGPSSPQEILFPYRENRRPWLTTFNTRAPARVAALTLIAVHFPPAEAAGSRKRSRLSLAEDATENVAMIEEVKSLPPGILVVTGDFNIDVNSPRGGPPPAGFAGLVNRQPGLTRHLRGAADGEPLVRGSVKDKFHKVVFEPRSASQNSFMQYSNEVAYDNFLTAGVAGAAGGNAAKIVDYFVGLPAGYPARLMDRLNHGKSKPLDPTNLASTQHVSGPLKSAFAKTWLSDHLPLYLDLEV